jgi:hypothetical protein
MSMRALPLVLVVVPLALAAPARAADPPKTGVGAAPLAKPPRGAAEILADASKALGPEAAWKAHKNVRMKLEMSFQGMGITGTAERSATKEDKSVVITDLPGMGTTREGSNGKVAWKQDPINGLRELSGGEAEWLKIESAWNPELRLAELYKSVEVAPSAPAGQECVVLTPREAPAVTNCYDAKTHLQVTQKGSEPTPQGDVPFTSTLKDWREAGGLKVPFAVDTQAGPITFTAKLLEVKFDQPMSEAMFDPPSAGEGAPAAPGKAKAAKKPKAKAKPKK